MDGGVFSHGQALFDETFNCKKIIVSVEQNKRRHSFLICVCDVTAELMFYKKMTGGYYIILHILRFERNRNTYFHTVFLDETKWCNVCKITPIFDIFDCHECFTTYGMWLHNDEQSDVVWYEKIDDSKYTSFTKIKLFGCVGFYGTKSLKGMLRQNKDKMHQKLDRKYLSKLKIAVRKAIWMG